MPSLTVFGSTGSIGTSILRVVDQFPDILKVQTISCGSNLSVFIKHLEKYKPENAVIAHPENCLKDDLESLEINFPRTSFYYGEEGLVTAASVPADICVSAIVGAAGLKPTLTAIKSHKRIALANKETLVMAGNLVLDEAASCNTEIIPVDSEHSALHALLNNRAEYEIDSLIITASGGSLRDTPLEHLPDVTVDEALNHPTWTMGSKITIDSATLFNKGLEVIEAHYLFNIPYNKIRVLVHPESVIHALVETIDGSIFAHMGTPDMVNPISQALFYPEMMTSPFARLNLEDVEKLSFRKFNDERYPALKLCYQAGVSGGTMPAVLNAANEKAVYAFLDGRIKFTEIVEIVEGVMSDHSSVANPALDDIFMYDSWARKKAEKNIQNLRII
jgi:1-deoxy-D-xylulose-5-phosphate reductoisomerase